MLFNSYHFLFLFLPITLFVFFKIGRMGHHRVAIAWLTGASLFFYGWWNPLYLWLFLFSIFFNYSIGVALTSSNGRSGKKPILILGIATNLGLLGYYKYANFFIGNINGLFGSSYHLEKIILPLAISFFTFQQITYLVDAYRGETREYNFLHYCLFVTFFPQLIAGPIVHHREMLPQFAKNSIYRFNHENISVGLTILLIGLFKKVVIADTFALSATPVFYAADHGVVITFFEAWVGSLAYTFQLYFDFSGYSDMAIGLGRLFGIRLPINFNSPYKARSIIEFWRRWHITLSRFLRDYLYIPLGGNKKGRARRHINLMITMLLGGMWHGAGWTFVLWGGLHGIYLMINHMWITVKNSYGIKMNTLASHALARVITFIAIVIGWVLFRAETLDGATMILQGMAGINGFALPESFHSLLGPLAQVSENIGITFNAVEKRLAPGSFALITIFIAVVWTFPNTQEIMTSYKPGFETYKGEVGQPHWTWMRWKPGLAWAIVMATVAISGVLMLGSESEFLYFQF